MNRIKLTISTPDGVVLDQFLVTHWKEEADLDDEGVGSRASESLLMDRIRRAMERK
jgi:hypothetical protein